MNAIIAIFSDIRTILFIIIIVLNGCKDDGDFYQIEYLKFSDFGCENNYSWHLNSQDGSGKFIITSQEDFEERITINCNPNIDFSKYTLLIGVKQFSSGASLYDEKIEKNNSELVYTVRFIKEITTVAISLNYHAIIDKPSNNISISIKEVLK